MSNLVYRLFKHIAVFSLVLVPSMAFSDQLTAINADQHGLLFTLEGSNTVGARLAPEWAKAYLTAKGVQGVDVEELALQNEYRVKGRNGTKMVHIDIHAHGSTTGFVGLHDRTANIAMSSRSVKPEEAQQLSDLGDMFSSSAEHVVGIDGLAIIVNSANSIKQLTVDQIAQVFAGKITRWKQLGGPDRVITIYARDDNSGTYDTFSNLVLGKKYTLSAGARRYESNDKLSDSVSADKDAIGFVGLASVRRAKALSVSDSGARALLPEQLFVATEDYPLSRRLFLYTPTTVPNTQVSEFIAFAQSSLGQNIVERIGFVSQNPISLSVSPHEGPATYIALTEHAQRLSVNFRFQPDRADLDNKALRDIERLARYIHSHPNSHNNIQLIGFSNVESTEKRAQILSRLRATAVKSALYRYGVRTETVLGYGANLPVADALGASSSKNERVEVWVFGDDKLSTMSAIKSAPVAAAKFVIK